jgi:hypothetical protein
MILQESAELIGYEALLEGVWSRLKRAADDPSAPLRLIGCDLQQRRSPGPICLRFKASPGRTNQAVRSASAGDE